MPTKINSLEELKSHIKKGRTTFFISFGAARSSKNVDLLENGKFWIMNSIDGSTQTLTAKQMMNKGYTNIGHAIKEGIFYSNK